MEQPLLVAFAEPNRFPVGWRMSAHHHDHSYELLLVTAGRLRTTMSGRTFIAEPGTAVLHPPRVDHEEEALGGEPLETLYAAWDARSAPLPEAAPAQVVDRSGRIDAGLRWAADAHAAGTTAGRAAAAGLLRAVIHEYLAAAPTPDHELLARVVAHVRRHLSRPLGLAELARAAGLSRYHFARAFRKATGQSPVRWLGAQRVSAAWRLLATTDLGMDAVAEQVGFSDRFQLSRAFRRHTGRAPSTVRKRRSE
jgi:AraC-like DNA-binding protein